jgi:hypothetical protein
VTAHAQAPHVTVLGMLLQAAQLRISGDATHTTVRLLLAQPDGLPALAATYVPPGSGMAPYIAWRQMVHGYARGAMVQVTGRGLRSRTLDGQRVLALDLTDSVQLLQPPFDARAAAAGDWAKPTGQGA